MEIDVEPWWKLFDRDQAVGFKKKAGRFAFFSSDGYGWSGTPKKSDLAVCELPIRDCDNHRLFEGDVVAATWMERQDAYVVLQDQQGNCYLGTSSGVLIDVSADEMRRDLAVHRNLGNIFVDRGLQADFDKSIRKFQIQGKSFLRDKILMSLTVTAAVLVGCFLQLQWFGAIGPLMTIVCLLGGIFLYLIARKRTANHWMTRGAIFAITPTVSAAAALAVSGFYSFLARSLPTASDIPGWLVGLTLWATLFLLCFGGIPIIAQVLGFQGIKPVNRDRL
ncbi:MAG: hypothetical protein VYA11_03415 [Planctomycetota bacterium]|nr:hypothetical protein [Planctomycetota bacterium]